MSSILKALKKLEDETPPEAQPDVIDARKVLHNRLKGIWIVNNVLTGFLTAAVVVGMVGVIVVWKPVIIQKLISSEQIPATSTVTTVPAPQPPDKPLEKTAPILHASKAKPSAPSTIPLTAPSQTKAFPVSVKPAPSLHEPEKKVQIIIPESSPPLQPIRIEPRPRPEELSAEDNHEAEPSEDIETEPEASENDEPQLPPVLPHESSEPDAPVMTDGRLKIQALVWAKDPSARMAVINDRIVRTNGFIDDSFVVTYIGNNYVMVAEGEKLWKVEFQGK